MIGIFGGSFDPIHFGHIKTALSLIEHYDFEQIRFIPCQISPLKKNIYASAEHRMQMLRLICNNYEKFKADNIELNRPTPSYTIDTILELREKLGEFKHLILIMGIDAFLQFCKWHRYDEILLHCHTMILQRPGFLLPEQSCEKDILDLHLTNNIKLLKECPSGKIFITDLEKIDISSTTIRNMISDGKQPRYLVPGNVWNYIKRNKLYQ